MEPLECVLFDEDWEETLDDDVEMVDAEPTDAQRGFQARKAVCLAGSASDVGGGGDRGSEEVFVGKGGANVLDNEVGKARRKRIKKKKKMNKRKGGSVTNINAINRFVINTCRQLKEMKSYLVWNAVNCLGVSAISDILKEVDAIQRCGGQKTVDGKRFRTGGGVLWNILKIREPKAYKEIMEKGKEFEKQFKHPQNKQSSKRNETASQLKVLHCNAAEDATTDSSRALQEEETSESPKKRLSVHDRIRVPVTYDDDLLEEGEIHEPSLLP